MTCIALPAHGGEGGNGSSAYHHSEAAKRARISGLGGQGDVPGFSGSP
jgi:hypothetical protein